MRVVGEIEVEDVLEGTPEEVWKKASHAASIDRAFFNECYSSRSRAVAFRLGRVRRFEEPRDLSDYGLAHAPRSFAYVKDR